MTEDYAQTGALNEYALAEVASQELMAQLITIAGQSEHDYTEELTEATVVEVAAQSEHDYTQQLHRFAAEVAQELEADILLYNGNLYPRDRPDTCVINLCDSVVKKRPNVMLIPVTRGGDANIAYRIARCLQDNYGTFYAYITGLCKSAGTLMALGAHEIVMSDHGELGPLDVQISKPDELFGMGSGLDAIQALDFLKQKTSTMLQDTLVELKNNSGNRMSTKSAIEIATNLSTGVFRAVYEQVDPTRLGEIARAMRIAQEYGRRLSIKSQNLRDGALQRLVEGYPTHAFVIDRSEAQLLFKHVRKPNASEIMLAGYLELVEGLSREPKLQRPTLVSQPIIRFISPGLEEGDVERKRRGEETNTETEREVSRLGLEGTEGESAATTSGDKSTGHRRSKKRQTS